MLNDPNSIRGSAEVTLNDVGCRTGLKPDPASLSDELELAELEYESFLIFCTFLAEFVFDDCELL